MQNCKRTEDWIKSAKPSFTVRPSLRPTFSFPPCQRAQPFGILNGQRRGCFVPNVFMQVCLWQTCSEQKTKLYLQKQFSLFAVGGDFVKSFRLISLPSNETCSGQDKFMSVRPIHPVRLALWNPKRVFIDSGIQCLQMPVSSVLQIAVSSVCTKVLYHSILTYLFLCRARSLRQQLPAVQWNGTQKSDGLCV